MAKLPTYRDLGGLQSGRSGRQIASHDTSAVGRGMQRAGQSMSQAGNSVARGAKALGAGLQAIGEGAETYNAQVDSNQKKADRFEYQRKFLEFSSNEQKLFDEAKKSVEPGAVGFEQQYQQGYKERAYSFFKTLPEDLKPSYDSKLFGVEDRLTKSARSFESAESRRYYTDEVNDGLTKISNDLFANPGNYDQNLAEGKEFIDNIPDDRLSKIEKDQLRDQWEQKAQLAALNGVSPEERIRLLGGDQSSSEGAPTTGDAQKMTRGIKGDIRSTITDAAVKYGVDPHSMLVIAKLESGGDPSVKNKRSSAGGLFQFIDDTAKVYNLQDRYDPVQASDAAARLARDNAVVLRKVLGREPTTGELYLAHQQGAGGAAKMLSNPNAMAVDVVGADAVRLNGGHAGMTAGEFAGLWLKKAGDTNVPDGTFGKFDPSKADPRFQNLDYSVASKMISDSQIEIGKSQRAEAAAAADMARAAAAEAKEAAIQAKDDYNLAIELEKPVTIEEILADDRIDNGDKAVLIGKLKEANSKALDLQEAMARANGDGLYNGLDTDDKKSANLAFDEMTKGTDDPNYFRLYGEAFSAKGVVPKGYTDRIQFGAQSTNPENVAMAASMASRLVDSYPQAVSTSMSKKDREAIQDLAVTHDFMKHKMGLSDEEIGQRLIERNDPEKMRQREQLMKSDLVKDHIKDITPDYVADQISVGSGRVFDYQLGTDPAASVVITNEWKNMFEENLASTGSIEEATELTNSQFSRSYGPSPLSQAGEDVITYLPATIAYPPTPDGSHNYLQEQALEALAGEGINASNVYFEHAIDDGVNLTEMGHRKGLAPEYQLYYDDENGNRQAFPFPFYADPAIPAAKQKLKAALETQANVRSAREANSRSRAQETQRQMEIETGKPAKSVFQEMDDAVTEFENLGAPEGNNESLPSSGGSAF